MIILSLRFNELLVQDGGVEGRALICSCESRVNIQKHLEKPSEHTEAPRINSTPDTGNTQSTWAVMTAQETSSGPAL